MKIYTKNGDLGETDLIGKRTGKDDLQIECYGTFDEVNSHIGLLIAQLETAFDVKRELYIIQRKIFDASFQLASVEKKTMVTSEDILSLEKQIDRYTEVCPVLNGFILPGGSISASEAHVIRTIVRRFERRLVELSRIIFVDDLLIKYANRLSDYFFSLARYLNHNQKLNDIIK